MSERISEEILRRVSKEASERISSRTNKILNIGTCIEIMLKSRNNNDCIGLRQEVFAVLAFIFFK